MSDHAISGATFTAEERDLLLAANVVHHLQQGHQLATIPPNFRSKPDEQVFACFDIGVQSYIGRDVVYPSNFFLAFGHPALMLATAGTSLAVNALARSRARREAAPQWRPDLAGRGYVTNKRIAIQGLQWTDLWYGNFNAIELTGIGLVAHYSNWPIMRFAVDSPLWLWAVLSYHVLGRFVDIPISPELDARARAAAAQPIIIAPPAIG